MGETIAPRDGHSGELNQDLVQITPQEDRAWMESLGCRWPGPEQEPEWLAKVNYLAELGSERERTNAPLSEEAESARLSFWALLEDVPREMPRHAFRRRAIPPLDTTINGMRLLYANGVALARIVNSSAGLMAFTYSQQSLSRRIKMLCALGLEAGPTLSNFPALITWAPGSLQRQARPMYAAARMWGQPEPHGFVTGILKEVPGILACKADKTRLMTMIASNMAEAPDPEALTSSRILGLYIQPARVLVAAYLLYGSAVRSITALKMHAQRLRLNSSDQELLGLIDKHADDPIVRFYMRAYPTDTSRLNGLAMQSRDGGDVPLHWQGPAMLGDPAYSSFNAFRAAVDGVPELTGQERTVLLGELGAEPHQDEDESSTMVRRALVVRHLGVAVKLAGRHARGLQERDELLGVASLTLWKAGLEYNPASDGDFATYASDRILAAFAVPYSRRDKEVVGYDGTA